jgi:hypothetical protein
MNPKRPSRRVASSDPKKPAEILEDQKKEPETVSEPLELPSDKPPPMPSEKPRASEQKEAKKAEAKKDETKKSENKGDEIVSEELEMPSEKAAAPMPSQKSEREVKILYRGLYTDDADQALGRFIETNSPKLQKVLDGLEGQDVFRGRNPLITKSKRDLKRVSNLTSFGNATVKESVLGKRDRAMELVDMTGRLAKDKGIEGQGKADLGALHNNMKRSLDSLLKRFKLETIVDDKK